jgi:hypothetical protein
MGAERTLDESAAAFRLALVAERDRIDRLLALVDDLTTGRRLAPGEWVPAGPAKVVTLPPLPAPPPLADRPPGKPAARSRVPAEERARGRRSRWRWRRGRSCSGCITCSAGTGSPPASSWGRTGGS